jgi:hypothetical protein
MTRILILAWCVYGSLLLAAIYFTQATTRRVLGALAGGCAVTDKREHVQVASRRVLSAAPGAHARSYLIGRCHRSVPPLLALRPGPLFGGRFLAQREWLPVAPR